MEIELSYQQKAKLAQQAIVAGFDSVEAYAAGLLAAYAELAFTSNDGADFATSLALLQESDDDLVAGRTSDLRDALAEIAAAYDLPLRQ